MTARNSTSTASTTTLDKYQTAWQSILNYLNHSLLFTDDIGFVYASSIGCKLLQEYHSKHPIYFISGIPEKTLNLHIMNIAPSGLGKSYLTNLFTDKNYGILPFNLIPYTEVGMITEAGLVGTVINGRFKEGCAETYSNGILISHEMSSLFDSESKEHSKGLINQLLQIMTECRASKDLSTGSVSFETNLLVWGCIQPSRFDFASGLGRRFIYITKIWTEDDINALKKFRTRRRGIRINGVDLSKLREYIHEQLFSLNDAIKDIEDIQFDDKISTLIEQYSSTPSEMQLLERFCIGYQFMNTPAEEMPETLVISHSKQLEVYLQKLYNMRRLASIGTDIYVLLNYVKSKGGVIDIETTWQFFQKLGYNYKQFFNTLTECINYRFIEYTTDQKGRRLIRCRQ